MDFLTLALLVSFLPILGIVTIQIQQQISGFVSFASITTLTDETGILANPTVLAAQPGVLTTHTTNTTGSLTMTNSSHGIVTGQRIDIYWTGGQCYGAVAGTVAGSVVPIASVSGGSNLPASSTAVTVGIPISAPFPVTGNNIQAVAMFTATVNGYFVFNNGSADVSATYLLAGQTSSWYVGAAGTNPLASATPTVVWMSHSDTAASHKDLQVMAATH